MDPGVPRYNGVILYIYIYSCIGHGDSMCYRWRINEAYIKSTHQQMLEGGELDQSVKARDL